MADIGFNPAAALPDPTAPNFFEEAMSLGDAMISVEGDSQIHFPNSARDFMTWLLMFVRLVEGVNGNLGMVRDLLTDDLQAVAKAAVATGHPRIGSLARKYTEELSRELQGVISTAETQRAGYCLILCAPLCRKTASNSGGSKTALPLYF
jgi:hypothetical protein